MSRCQLVSRKIFAETIVAYCISMAFSVSCYFDLLIQVTLKNRSNAIAWNPMEAYIFTVANEDYKSDNFSMLCLHFLFTNLPSVL